jgi:hypothetical protein
MCTEQRNPAYSKPKSKLLQAFKEYGKGQRYILNLKKGGEYYEGM